MLQVCVPQIQIKKDFHMKEICSIAYLTNFLSMFSMHPLCSVYRKQTFICYAVVFLIVFKPFLP